MATIRKRKWTNKSGTHEAWVLNFMDASGKRHREQFEKKRDAEARRVDVEGQVRTGAFRADAAKTTVDQACGYFEKAMITRKDRGEKVTEDYLINTQGHLWNYISPQPGRQSQINFKHGIGEIKLSQMTARTVASFRDSIRAAGIGVVTTRKILGTLSRVLQYAVANDLAAINVAAGIRVIGKRDEDAKKIVPPSKHAMAAILKAADDDFRVKLIFAAASGLRASEQHALRWRHLDLKAGSVTIETRVDRKRNEDTTKSKAGLREIPLGSQVITVLKAWRLKSKFKKDSDLVFPNSRGNFESHENMRKRTFYPLVSTVSDEMKKAGKPFERFGWHALRHFAISTWIEAGLPPKTVQTFAGHSSLAVTMDRYGHLFPSETHRHAMDAIAFSLFSNGA